MYNYHYSIFSWTMVLQLILNKANAFLAELYDFIKDFLIGVVSTLINLWRVFRITKNVPIPLKQSFQTQHFSVCLAPRLPHITGEKRFGTVIPNSWSKHQTCLSLKKDIHCNKHLLWVKKMFDDSTKNLKQLFQTIFRPYGLTIWGRDYFSLVHLVNIMLIIMLKTHHFSITGNDNLAENSERFYRYILDKLK